MNILNMAKKYYPQFWDKDRIRALVNAGKLTEADYKEITGENF